MKRKKRISFIVITIITALLSIFYFASFIKDNKDNLKDYKESKNFYDSLSRRYDLKVPTTKDKKVTLPSVNFKRLKSINKDVIYYLIIEGTNIKYPVVQGTDNKYYLHRLINKEYNYGGSLFLDYRCGVEPDACYSIIYGHNMKDGSMFGNLDRFRDKSYMKKHNKAWLIALDHIYSIKLSKLDIVSVNSDAFNFKNKSSGKLILSTCSYESDNSRLILHGNIKKVYNKGVDY